MASRIIVQQTSEADTNNVSSGAATPASVNLIGATQGATIQRIVKTSNGKQIYLSGLGSNARPVGVNVGAKRSLTPDHTSQPPTKIKLTHSNSNVNLPVVATAQKSQQGFEAKQVISLRTDGSKTPQKVMHVTSNTPLPGNARRVVLSPVKGAGKVTMVPLSASNQMKTVSSSVAKVVNLNKSLSNTSLSSQGSNMLTMSPQKLIIKGQDSSSQNVVFQQKAPNNSSGLNLNTSSNVQPIQVSGSKFQYVRLVSSNSNIAMQTVSKATTIQASSQQQRTLAPYTTASAIAPKETVLITQKPQAQLRPAKSSQQPSQRLILPATSQVPIRPNLTGAHYSQLNSGATGPAQALTSLPPGTTIISSGQNNLQGGHGVQGFALVPAQYVTQLQQQYTSQPSIQPNHQQANTQVSATRHDSSYVQLQQQQQPVKTVNRVQSHSQNSNPDIPVPSSNRPRKPCNCTKSQCLKLYCECFANGEFCYNCNCNNCFNNLDHEEERSRAIKACLDRNPNAFRPKIGKDKTVKGERRHNKGCNCKRSGCLKNYCECYEAKIMCTHLCKCVGCKNFEESPEKKTLMHLADAAEVRKQQQVSAKHKLSTQIQDIPSRPTPTSSGHRLPFSFVTSEVAEATCSCLIAQAEETERTRQIDTIQEKMILEEFGRCLMQVIESANRTEPGTAV